MASERPSQHRGISTALGSAFFGSGESIAGVVYGTIVVMAALAAAYSTEKRPGRLAVVVGATAIVLWVAHLYAHGLSLSITRGHRLGRADLRQLAKRELGILLAGALRFSALVLGALGLVDEPTAVWLAFGLGIVTLGAERVRYARIERLGAAQATLVVCANLALGLVVVLMKVLLDH